MAVIAAATAGAAIGKKVYSAISNVFDQSKRYEAEMDPVWAAGAQKAVDAHRRVGTSREAWSGNQKAAPEGFRAYLPGDIWNPLPVRAPAGNEISGCAVQGPRPSGMTEAEWVERDQSKYPTPSAPASAANVATAGIGAIGSSSTTTLVIIAIVALILFTHIGKK